MSRRVPALSLSALIAAVAATSACAADESADTDDTATSLSNCGHEVETSGVPQEAITLDQNSLETMLELGLSDRIRGAANLRVDIPDRYQEDFDVVEVLNDSWLTGEQLREAAPDFVYSGFESHYSTDGVGTREELAELEVATYASEVDCPEQSPDKGAFDRLFTDYRNIGELFDIDQKADELVADQRDTMETAGELKSDLNSEVSVVYIYSFFDGQPYVAGNGGMPQAFSDVTGVDNAFADVDGLWPEVSLEDIALRDPDVIVIGDLSERGMPGDAASEKREELESHPVSSELDAVINDRIIEIPGIAMDPSVRSVEALEQFANGVRDLGYVD